MMSHTLKYVCSTTTKKALDMLETYELQTFGIIEFHSHDIIEVSFTCHVALSRSYLLSMGPER